MKTLVTIILLLCALTTRAQNSRRATVQPDTSSYKVDLANTPKLASDSLQNLREASRKRRYHSGLVWSIVGVSMMAGGAAILGANPNGFIYDVSGAPLFKAGSVVTLVGGCLLLGSIRPHYRDRYSVVIHPNGLGLAYNF